MADSPVPGTVHLIDLTGSSTLQHGKSEQDIILLPQPTRDPQDPLNWTPKRRLNSSVWQMLWTFVASGHINGLTPAYLLIQAETGISIGDLNTGNGLMYLFFGFGNLVTQPLALNYGRRPCAFWALFVTSFLVLWASFMNTAAEWYANRILIGIAMSGIECLIELCITDTKFTHERGFHMGFYNWVLFGGAVLAPIPAGFLADAAGWRWINRMYFIVGFVTTIGVFFFFEETMFYRPKTVAEFIQAGQSTASDEQVPTPEDEKAASAVAEPSGEELGETYTVTSYAQRLKLWGHRDPRQENNFFRFFLVPFQLLKFPGIVFSGILVGSVLSWFNVLLGTVALIFGDDPYNFSANIIGLMYIPCILGITVGCLLSGWLNDTLATALARRNNGVKEPEARLWAAVIPLVLHPAGCILYGVGAAHQIHWVGLCFGIGIICCSIVMGSTLALNYTVDSYKEVTGEALVTVIIIRNIMGMLRSLPFMFKNANSLGRIRNGICDYAHDRKLGPSKHLAAGGLPGHGDFRPLLCGDSLGQGLASGYGTGVLEVGGAARFPRALVVSQSMGFQSSALVWF